MTRKTSLMLLKALFGAMSIGMVVIVVLTSLKSNMFALPEVVVNEPWFRTTLIDFYFNIAIISAWTIYKENNAARSFLWITGFVMLGSIVTALYVFVQLSMLRPADDLQQLFVRKGRSV